MIGSALSMAQRQMDIQSALVNNAETLEVDCFKELADKVTDGTVHAEVQRALAFCTELFRDSR